MKQKNITLAFFILAVCLFTVRFSFAKIFDIHEFYLDNGLKVMVIPNHKAPIIKHMVWYKVGSIDEPLGKSGKAHLLEHLLFRGTKNVRDSEFTRIIEENGGESNAFTSLDYTAYHQTIDITRLELAMYLEADRMVNLDFSTTSFEKERDIVFQERKQVVENNPLGYFSATMRSILWGSHQYGRPIIGTDEEIKAFTVTDVIDFYNTFYSPNNALLVLSGDIKKEEAELLAKKYYGKIVKKNAPIRPVVSEIKDIYSTRFEMEVPNIKSPRIIKSYITHSYNTNKDSIYALSVLAKILGDGENSKLYKDLVLKQKIALDASASYSGFSRSYSTFSISIMPRIELDILDVEKAFEKSIKDMIASITEEEVINAKKKMLSGLVYIRDNPSDAAYIVGSMAAVGASKEDIEIYDDKIKNVSFEDIKKASSELLHNSQNIIAVALPKRESKNNGE